MEFDVEISVVSRLRHRNLVSLLGFCDDAGEEILVYEFVPNGTLEEHLHPKPGTDLELRVLSFEDRLKIACGAAEGLNYLHSFATPAIVHRDIKPTNLLLERDMSVKVADFGLLKYNEGLGEAMTTAVRGTVGYMDPDYFNTHRVTTKSDVYSLGVVLLQLVTGKAAISWSTASSNAPDVANNSVIHDKSNQEADGTNHLVPWALPFIKGGEVHKIVDWKLQKDYPLNQMEALAGVAALCVEEATRDRPEMAEVAARLSTVGLVARTVHDTAFSDSSSSLLATSAVDDGSSSMMGSSDFRGLARTTTGPR